MLPEKLTAEVAAMGFIADETTIPVPLILHAGTQKECPGNLGPFMVLEYVEHECTASEFLNIPERGTRDRPLLDLDIGAQRLETFCAYMAHVLLRL